MLKRFKPAYQLYNFFQKKQLDYLTPLYKKYGLNKKYYSNISYKDIAHLPKVLNWLDEEGALEKLEKHPDFLALSPNLQKEVRQWPEKGYIILRGFFRDEADKINNTVDDLIKAKKVKFKFGNRIMFTIHKSEYLLSIGQNKQLKNIIDLLLGRNMKLFSSINFLKASEQRAHSDEYHMTTYPHANIIAAWIALEKVNEENGTLFFYPGSHRLPYVMNEDFGNDDTTYMLGNKDYEDYEDKIEAIIKENNLQPEIFTAEKGDVLIWHANIIHGGLPLKNPQATRKSMVFHYYAEDVICFHEITRRPTLKKI